MTSDEGSCDKAAASECIADTPDTTPPSVSSEAGSSDNKVSKVPTLSGLFSSAFSLFGGHSEPSASEKKEVHSKDNWLTASVKKVVAGGSMRRIHERVLGPSKIGISSSTSDIWLLGVCYRVSEAETSGDVTNSNGLAAFELDFSSRILITYRKGFDGIEDTKFTSDASWGCMLRSSQMLVAQALVFHLLGRSWRRSLDKPLDKKYVDILHLFGDSEESALSIHNLLKAGKAYGLAAGSWIGPYATCRAWESLARCRRDETSLDDHFLPMAVYIVSGDEDGPRGGAPVVCIEDAHRHCLEFSKGQVDWTPILLLVPLVLGLDKINTRYFPSLKATFSFPQSLGILGGKPGASTYIVGVQDDNAFYLDPHDVQSVVNISRENLEADASSYHSNIIRHIPLDIIDPSLAIGFYCRDKGDFDDFCSRASKLSEESNGAPLFTVVESHKHVRSGDNDGVEEDESFDVGDAEGSAQEDDWQFL